MHAEGALAWRVELSGTVVPAGDKHVASARTYLAGGIDVSNELRQFARKCALDVLHLWDAPEAVVRYLKTGDENTRDIAENAAKNAALNGASDTVSDAWAAWAAWAAWTAASDASWAATSDAAPNAAAGAASYAAKAAAWDAHRAASSATRQAADAAAFAAAEKKQNRRLTRLLNVAIKARKK